MVAARAPDRVDTGVGRSRRGAAADERASCVPRPALLYLGMTSPLHLTPLDRALSRLGRAMASVAGSPPASRPSPASSLTDGDLSAPQRADAAALMRVNHVGEVCAQALYEGQAMSTRDPALRRHLQRAAAEEADHLAWTRQRIDELGGRPSLLNPLWYAGAFALGVVAGRAGDRWSLGFVAETERQVEAHLEGHLQRLPAEDERSRAVLARMRDDEVAHGQAAVRLGAAELPGPVKSVMRASAGVMTTVAHYL